jgi:hypothetical protein
MIDHKNQLMYDSVTDEKAVEKAFDAQLKRQKTVKICNKNSL